jgi:osmoprotectant transport system permease protein
VITIGALNVFVTRWPDIWSLTLEHLYLSLISIVISILISVPLGIWLTRHRKISDAVIGVTSIFQTIPSLALLVFLVPIIGTGKLPAIIALTIYGLLPILRNTYLGILSVDDSLIEAGIGMGMTSKQVLWKIELPLALNVVMGGVRTASVLIIGVATIAGLIGAGGLGDLIYRGLQTYNTGLILAGAIPSALLAILFDFILKRLEIDVTPRGLSKDMKKSKKGIVIFRWIVIGVIVLGLVGSSFAQNISSLFAGGRQDTITITGKNFTEQEIMVYIMGELIKDKTHLNVKYDSYLGGTAPVINGMKNGNYDLYAEYTGTGEMEILKETPKTNDPNKVYQHVKKEFDKKYNLEWLKPIGFNNTYTLTVQKSFAKKNNLKTFSDLKNIESNLTLGSEPEFLERPDGYPGLEKAYGLKFGKTNSMDSGIMYSALKNGNVDVIDAYSTDGRIPAFNLQVLKDDKHYFPPYYAAPVIRKAVLEKHPELKKILNSLDGKIDNAEMQKLNAEVDLDKKDPKDVAKEFLKQSGLIK